MTEYETIIGLEVHAQLKTRTKIFCGCSTAFANLANHQVCPVCMGLPGALPVLNRDVVHFALKTGLALNCEIHPTNTFARKNYFYPDLPKGYQISQYENPLATGGFVEIPTENPPATKIGITRIHLEEDAGKNIHDETGRGGESLVDYNRAGVPLVEIVSEPNIRTPQEGAAYLKELRSILKYLDVCDGNMEEGSFRCDANISLRPVGSKEFGTKVEVKNMNSFKHVEKALAFEVERQRALLTSGQRIVQETRLWDTTRQVTQSMRSKEEAHDYRYFPEPDLLPLFVDPEWIERVRGELPELPAAKRARFRSQFGLSTYDTTILTDTQRLADYFEAVCRIYPNPKHVANWIITEVLRELADPERDLTTFALKPQDLATLLKQIEDGTISGKIAKDVFKRALVTGESPTVLIETEGLRQISDTGAIERIIDALIEAHPKEAGMVREGKTKVIGFFIGEVMKQTKGKANPQLVNALLNKKLGPET